MGLAAPRKLSVTVVRNTIPLFPELKKLEMCDKGEIDAFGAQFPPYSDFEFASLWLWDVKGEMRVSWLHDNLVIKFTDYTTGEPFFTFLGTNRLNETARTLLERKSEDMQPVLRLVPEVAIEDLDQGTFLIEESPDHFDYVCDVARHIEYSGNRLKSHRKLLNKFEKLYPRAEYVSLDMSSPEIRRDVANVFRVWDGNKGFLTTSEGFAYDRFVESEASLPHAAVGIRVEGKLIAFHIVSLPPGVCANALFGKADISYAGVYATLDHVVAKDLLQRGYTQMNIQQDLGIESLRAAKLGLHPISLLKKYSVRLR